jgi:hypothetical protein
MKLLLATVAIFLSASVEASEGLEITPFVQQATMALLSDEVTAGGLGGGLGAQVSWRRRYVAQLDASVLWAAGNSLVTRAAAGYQREGRWSPAAWGTFNALWGDRIERLSDDGRRPPRPSWAVGARISPLRFVGEVGFLSAFEPGVAVAPGGGIWVELTILQAGARW